MKNKEFKLIITAEELALLDIGGYKIDEPIQIIFYFKNGDKRNASRPLSCYKNYGNMINSIRKICVDNEKVIEKAVLRINIFLQELTITKDTQKMIQDW